MPRFLILFLLISLYALSQKTIIGVVSYTLNQPLESANLISKPLQEKAEILFLKSFIYYFSLQATCSIKS
jgi:hypothetical protein